MHNLKHLKQERSIFKMILILGSIISSCIVAAKDVATTNFPHQNDVNAQFFGVDLGLSRIIYVPGSSGENIAVKNNQIYPMLVQSQMFDEDTKSKAPFITTPPLFRLDGKQTSRIRIIQTGGDFPEDREKLQWLCVKGIPPRDEDKWAEGQAQKRSSLHVQFSVNNCIKVFVRPDAVKGRPEDVADKVTWTKKGSVLEATNPTPFYINIKELIVGGRTVKSLKYISPFGKQSFDIPASVIGDIQWKIITDFGGESKPYQAEIQ
ncbi:TPA: fimbria/pilus periplasmic chaperone [Escherichia coli]|jgi:P pilus assembly chaperone PapD|uniref:fimbria/pilus periplasmic chaperone n=2 Tax=Escherichia coli TaxID=562 RepID=UPI0004DAC6B9|nr:fimbria/pilus periplasmic chaperone [Escherichia coli]KDV96395.1 putative fimbriae assembly chaparone [Escherichia coli 2-156-04_S3_C1]MDA6991264.1 fimbria/pilus periplasmic chaperone [Escherichia coli]MDF3971415.1 fimbria/pilus periplasmic chaperone [Escherichia coli]